VLRYDPAGPDGPRTQSWTIPYTPDMSVLQALQYIKDNLDGSLTFRWSCRMAICGSCGVMVNGVPHLGCRTFVRDFLPGPIRVEALAHFPIERDLVVDAEDFIEKLREIHPWSQPKTARAVADGPYRQTPDELARYESFSHCINCMLCYSACPVVMQEPDFLGPAASALGHRYNMDSRDEGAEERNEVFRGDGSIFHCSYANECSEVCPKNVDPAAAINQAKLLAVVDWAKGFVVPRKGKK
jgi:fumarate reductase iron-sulfur subunit